MDALMPGLSGFETCRRITADPGLQHILVIYMTGLSETAHIVESFDAGGVDYVVKPVRAQEVLARLATHLRNARAARLAREALDVGGHGVLVLDGRGRIAWRSPQAQRWSAEFFNTAAPAAPANPLPGALTDACADWLRAADTGGAAVPACAATAAPAAPCWPGTWGTLAWARRCGC